MQLKRSNFGDSPDYALLSLILELSFGASRTLRLASCQRHTAHIARSTRRSEVGAGSVLRVVPEAAAWALHTLMLAISCDVRVLSTHAPLRWKRGRRLGWRGGRGGRPVSIQRESKRGRGRSDVCASNNVVCNLFSVSYGSGEGPGVG